MPRSIEGRLATALLVLVVAAVSIQLASTQDETALVDAAREGAATQRNRALYRLEARGAGSPSMETLVRSAFFDEDPDVACFTWMRHGADGMYAADGARAISSRSAMEQQRCRLIALRTKRLEDLEACLAGPGQSPPAAAVED